MIMAHANPETTLADIEREILRYTLRRLDVYPNQSRDSVFRTVRTQLSVKTLPLILQLQHYLERCKEIAEGCLTANILVESSNDHVFEAFQTEESRVIECYNTDALILTHKFWLFLCWLMKQILNSPSYLNGIERRMRRFPVSSFPEVDLRMFLVLANTSGLRTLMKSKSHTDRRSHINDTIRRLDPKLCVNWESEWRALSHSFGQAPKDVAARLVALRFHNDGSVWLNSAQRELCKRGVEMGRGSLEVGSP